MTNKFVSMKNTKNMNYKETLRKSDGKKIRKIRKIMKFIKIIITFSALLK